MSLTNLTIADKLVATIGSLLASWMIVTVAAGPMLVA